MAAAMIRRSSDTSRRPPASRPASAGSRLAPVETPAAHAPAEPAGEPQAAHRAGPWRAPSAETLLALTLLLGLLLNLAAFLDPHLFAGLSGRLGFDRPAPAGVHRAPGWSELLLAGVPLLSGLALLGLGSFAGRGTTTPSEDS